MRLIFILLVCFPLSSYSQLQESFDDGDFTTNPVWSGTTDFFIVNSNNELQLNNTDAGTSHLFTSSQAIEEATWQIRVKMDFNPSSSNYTRIYLCSNSEQLTDANNALFVELGSTDDNICLFKIENGTKEKMIEGAVDRLNLNTIEVTLRVTRSANNWTLESDMGTGWTQEGQAAFEFNHASSYFGICCIYTKTRADKFFFDDISIAGQAYTDKTPPEITNFELINGTQMRLTFNEALDASSINIEDFTLQNSQRHPESFLYNNDDFSVTLYFKPILEDTDHEQLHVSNIFDLDGNPLIATSYLFSYERIRVIQVELINRQNIGLTFTKPISTEVFNKAIIKLDDVTIKLQNITTDDQLSFTIELAEMLESGKKYNLHISELIDETNDVVPEINTEIMYFSASRFDVVFNEWMADPSPSMGLSEVEYIELINNSNYDVKVTNWTLRINDKTVLLPDSTIAANNFICLVSASATDEWNDVRPTAFVQSMPALNNSGFELSIHNENQATIDALIYQPSSVPGEGFKKDGGWSVERIDSNNKSGAAENFHWCMNLTGGTPGATNSVENVNADDLQPTITSLTLNDKQTLHIDFSETMNFDAFTFKTTPSLEVSQQIIDETFLNNVQIVFKDELVKNTIYQLSAISISDLAGNPLLLNQPITFGVPDTLEQGDLLINELLFNPYPDGADFVEVYNKSEKLIELSDLYFADVKNGEIEKLYPASSEKQLLLPHSYAAITPNKESLLQNYNCLQPDAIYKTSSLPAFPDDEGCVAISNKKGVVLDKFTYHQNMHFDLLKDKEGVSLERLSWQQATQASNNWQSAVSTAGFATPGYRNSQQLNEVIESNSTVNISPEVFTPNGDGFDDRLQIILQSDEPNTLATIRIFSAKGDEVRYLVNNQSISGNSYFTWDGLSDNRTELKPGIYIIYIQCVYPSGKVHEEKLSCVIGVKSN